MEHCLTLMNNFLCAIRSEGRGEAGIWKEGERSRRRWSVMPVFPVNQTSIFSWREGRPNRNVNKAREREGNRESTSTLTSESTAWQAVNMIVTEGPERDRLVSWKVLWRGCFSGYFGVLLLFFHFERNLFEVLTRWLWSKHERVLCWYLKAEDGPEALAPPVPKTSRQTAAWTNQPLQYILSRTFRNSLSWFEETEQNTLRKLLGRA